ncbi:MAG: hypothetical protein IJ493_12070 [Clostridia bacterium]|nr:hypothetical protein [Clostridia bacterium]
MNGQTLTVDQKKQDILLRDRAYLRINGVEDVLSFDDVSIILKSNFGSISVDGSGLRITRLSTDTGELEIEGTIGGVFFFEPDAPQKKGRGLFGRRGSV